ncbi:MAG: hypothetical protein ABSD70_07325 [Terracidiphilus sp.]|jgi:hypothetical protein
MKSYLKFLTITGLVLGGTLGMAGTFVVDDHLRSLLWAIDGTGLIAATSLLAVRFVRAGEESLAAGFIVYAIGEAVMLGGTAGTLEASVPAFAAGTALWSAGLFLTSLPKVFMIWARIAAIIAATLFCIVSLRIFLGADITPLTKPLPYFAYPFLVITFAGWIVSTAKAE